MVDGARSSIAAPAVLLATGGFQGSHDLLAGEGAVGTLAREGAGHSKDVITAGHAPIVPQERAPCL